jgi:hypothetical protein
LTSQVCRSGVKRLFSPLFEPRKRSSCFRSQSLVDYAHGNFLYADKKDFHDFIYLTGYEKFLESAHPENPRDNPIPLPNPAQPEKVLFACFGSRTPQPPSRRRFGSEGLA